MNFAYIGAKTAFRGCADNDSVLIHEWRTEVSSPLLTSQAPRFTEVNNGDVDSRSGYVSSMVPSGHTSSSSSTASSRTPSLPGTGCSSPNQSTTSSSTSISDLSPFQNIQHAPLTHPNAGHIGTSNTAPSMSLSETNSNPPSPAIDYRDYRVVLKPQWRQRAEKAAREFTDATEAASSTRLSAAGSSSASSRRSVFAASRRCTQASMSISSSRDASRMIEVTEQQYTSALREGGMSDDDIEKFDLS